MSVKTVAVEAERVISKDAAVVVVVVVEVEMVSILRRHVDTLSGRWLGTACLNCITVSRKFFLEFEQDGLGALFFDAAVLIRRRLLFDRVLHGGCRT